jgi:Trans-aconitate methyltransferase
MIGLSSAYAKLAAHYDDLAGYSQFASARRAFEHAAARHGLRFRTAADFGCGTGLFVRYLCSRGLSAVYAVDRSPQMLRIARSRCGNAKFLLRDFAGLRLPRPVDLITTFSFTVNLRRNWVSCAN